jgi:hypothetical protein
MKTQNRRWLLLFAAVAVSLGYTGVVTAGNLEPPGPPGSTMHTLDEIYDKLEVIASQLPEGYDTGLPKTGQTTSYATGDDGDLENGVAWPSPRFTDNGNGTVIDNLTGLVWLKNANCFGARTWNQALSDCNGLASGACGLTDASNAGDWRLPNVRELQSLVHYGYYGPAVPNTAGTGQSTDGDPFTNVQSFSYWSSTSLANPSEYTWQVYIGNGGVYNNVKTNSYYVWPVR